MSLRQCRQIGGSGGKSGAFFAITHDEKYILKQINRKELKWLEMRGVNLFKHFANSMTGERKPSILTLFFGLFGVSYEPKQQLGATAWKRTIVVMANLKQRRAPVPTSIPAVPTSIPSVPTSQPLRFPPFTGIQLLSESTSRTFSTGRAAMVSQHGCVSTAAGLPLWDNNDGHEKDSSTMVLSSRRSPSCASRGVQQVGEDTGTLLLHPHNFSKVPQQFPSPSTTPAPVAQQKPNIPSNSLRQQYTPYGSCRSPVPIAINSLSTTASESIFIFDLKGVGRNRYTDVKAQTAEDHTSEVLGSPRAVSDATSSSATAATGVVATGGPVQTLTGTLLGSASIGTAAGPSVPTTGHSMLGGAASVPLNSFADALRVSASILAAQVDATVGAYRAGASSGVVNFSGVPGANASNLSNISSTMERRIYSRVYDSFSGTRTQISTIAAATARSATPSMTATIGAQLVNSTAVAGSTPVQGAQCHTPATSNAATPSVVPPLAFSTLDCISQSASSTASVAGTPVVLPSGPTPLFPLYFSKSTALSSSNTAAGCVVSAPPYQLPSSNTGTTTVGIVSVTGVSGTTGTANTERESDAVLANELFELSACTWFSTPAAAAVGASDCAERDTFPYAYPLGVEKRPFHTAADVSLGSNALNCFAATNSGSSFDEECNIVERTAGTYNTNTVNVSSNVPTTRDPQNLPVLLDQNLKEYTRGLPLVLDAESHDFLLSAIDNDLNFLCELDVIDYSILLLLDEGLNRALFGLIDFFRPYTWDKQVETVGKQIATMSIISGNHPTIVSPVEYRDRLKREVLSRFTAPVPISGSNVAMSQIQSIVRPLSLSSFTVMQSLLMDQPLVRRGSRVGDGTTSGEMNFNDALKVLSPAAVQSDEVPAGRVQCSSGKLGSARSGEGYCTTADARSGYDTNDAPVVMCTVDVDYSVSDRVHTVALQTESRAVALGEHGSDITPTTATTCLPVGGASLSSGHVIVSGTPASGPNFDGFTTFEKSLPLKVVEVCMSEHTCVFLGL